VAMVRVTAIEAADADRDGVPDQTDTCADHPGLLDGRLSARHGRRYIRQSRGPGSGRRLGRSR
jgi:hypothetical protein